MAFSAINVVFIFIVLASVSLLSDFTHPNLLVVLMYFHFLQT